MPPVFYKDLSKKGKDLLNKDFPTAFEVKAETRTLDGTAVETNLIRANDGSVAASLKPAVPLPAIGGAAEVSVNTAKNVTVEVSSANKVADGLTTKVKAAVPSFDSTQNATAALDLEYKHERVALLTSVDLLAKVHHARVSAVVPYEDFAFGVDTDVAVGGAPDLKRFGAAVNHRSKNAETTFYRRSEGSVVYGANYHHIVNDDISLATDVSYDASRDKAAPALTFGGWWRVAPDSAVKARASTNGRLGFSWISNVTRQVKLTFGLDVSAADTRDHKIGLGVNIHD